MTTATHVPEADDDAALWQGAPCGLLSLDARLGVIAINDTLLDWLGRDRSEWAASAPGERPDLPTLAGINDDRARGLMQAHVQELQTSASATPLELRFFGKDGRFFTAQLISSAVRDAQGRFVRTHTAVIDITERHKIEHQLVARVGFLQAITDRSPSRLAYYDKDLVCRYCNAAYADGYAMAPDDLIGLDLSAVVSPDVVGEVLPRVAKVLGGEAIDHEAERTAPDGTARYYSVHYLPDHQGDQVVGFFIELIDITERRRTEDFVFNANLDLEERVAQRSAELYASEQRWRQMSAAIREYSIFFIDVDGGVSDWTDSAQRLHGYERVQILGRSLDTLFHAVADGADMMDTQALLDLCLDTGHAAQEGWSLRRDGSRFWSSATLTALHDEQGALLGLSVITRDLTEAKKLADLMAQLNRDLEQRVTERTHQLAAANKDLDAFSYMVAHDLRAPLRHISQFVALAQEQLAPDGDLSMQQYLTSIASSGKRMGQMIEGLLEYSRLGRLAIETMPVSLTPLVQGVVGHLKAENPGRRIDWAIDPALPAVAGDPILLAEVFGKLLDNAVKFTRQTPEARIEVGQLPIDGPMQTLYVRDNGVGFDLDKAKTLFVMFQRQHHSMDYEGIGMGLALAQRIVDRHQGRIWCETAPDQGCTFFIELPPPSPDIALP